MGGRWEGRRWESVRCENVRYKLPALSLEAGMESDKKWMIRRLFKDMLLCLDPIYILMCVCTYHNK